MGDPEVVDGGGHTFRLTNVLLARQDGDATLTRLLAKVGRGEPLDAVDRVDLALVALMPQQRPLVELRFGTVPPALEVRSNDTQGEALDILYARAVLAERIEDLESSVYGT